MDRIERASINWLLAYEAFRRSGGDCLQMYVDADQDLLDAFTADWKDADPRLLRIAFLEFQDSLVQTQEPDPIVIPLFLKDLPIS